MRKYTSLTEQLRRAVLDCGQTRAAISKATGIGQDTLSRFVHGERGVSCEMMDTLGKYLGLRIMADKPKSKGKGRTKGR